MKIKPITLMLTLLVALGTIPAVSTPSQATPTTWGCYSGVETGGHWFYSHCYSSANIRQHRARARMYFDSGYGDTKWSNWRDKGVSSYSSWYEHAVVMNGPWVETW